MGLLSKICTGTLVQLLAKMFTSSIVVLIASILCCSHALQDPFDGQTFLIKNKYFEHANFGQIKKPRGEEVCHSCLGTSEAVHKNQLWKFTAAANYGGEPGYYYIENAIFGSRLALLNHKRSSNCPPKGITSGEACVCFTSGAYDGKYHLENHLWKVQLKHVNANPTWDYYYIKNRQEQTIYYQPMLTKEAQDDSSWGTLSCENTKWLEDLTLWRIVPRFKASAENAIIWQADNRKGSYPLPPTLLQQDQPYRYEYQQAPYVVFTKDEHGNATTGNLQSGSHAKRQTSAIM